MAARLTRPTRHVVLTGAPGAGKTAILRELERQGEAVVEEAATDVIALAQAQGVEAPHESPDFIDDILALQTLRLARAQTWSAAAVVHDRSAVCTLALAEFLGFPPSTSLLAQIDRLIDGNVFERRVLFVRTLGFIVNTAARRISYEDTLRFEAVHEAVYRRLGFELVEVAPGSVEARAGFVRGVIAESIG